MQPDQIFYSLLGGCLIGVAVTLLLLFNGRVAGVSGILASSLGKPSIDNLWRWMFVLGLLGGGFLMSALRPDLFVNNSGRSLTSTLVAGLLVGYGTVMAGGCTSGHGVCGISRLSIRSIVATLTFMIFGFLTVQGVRYFWDGSI